MRGFCRTFKQHSLHKLLSALSPVAIELYGFVVEHCDWRLGRYVSSTPEIAIRLGVTERSVQRANKELIASGLLKIKLGIYAVNPEFNWGGRSWNINKSSYYTMDKKAARIINFIDASEALHRSNHSNQTRGNFESELVIQRKVE